MINAQSKKAAGGAMPEIAIVPATSAHIREIANNLQPQDANEILRFGTTIPKALWWSFRDALIKRTALIDGKVAAIWGVCGSPMGDIGVPWLMTSPEVHRVSPLRFTKIYQAEALNMLSIFPYLVNWCDSGYIAAIRLLEISGFSIGEPEPMGSNGAMYCKFEMRL